MHMLFFQVGWLSSAQAKTSRASQEHVLGPMTPTPARATTQQATTHAQIRDLRPARSRRLAIYSNHCASAAQPTDPGWAGGRCRRRRGGGGGGSLGVDADPARRRRSRREAGWGLCASPRAGEGTGHPTSRLPFVSPFRPLCLRTEETPWLRDFELRGQVVFNRRTWGPTGPSHVSQRTAVRAGDDSGVRCSGASNMAHGLPTDLKRNKPARPFGACFERYWLYARRHCHHELLEVGVSVGSPRRRRFVPAKSRRRGW